MKRIIQIRILFVFLFILILPNFTVAQISARNPVFTDKTDYPVFQENDSIYIFCTEENINIGELIAYTSLSGDKTFSWDKYNNLSGAFEPLNSEITGNNESIISQLGNGCYRVTITKGDTIEIYRAWVLNDWFQATAGISESNCEFFRLAGSHVTARLVYYDLSNNAEIELNKDVKVEWKQGSSIIARVNNPQIFDPPTQDTDYKYVVFDRFGCSDNSDVTYISIVTKASFTVEAKFDSGEQQGEAPLEVTFTNTSENGTPGEYEWFFFRDLGQIKKESETSTEPIDSFMFVAYDDNLIYTFENTGTYMVKLVSKKISEYHIPPESDIHNKTCTDTFYLEDFIVTDSSFFDFPNFFTPDGNGSNDNFVGKFWSMQDVKITIVNRWGRTVHYWEKSNVRGFEGTWNESIWDGKIGGRYASPGVYYYVAEGLGRDGLKRWAHGFFHLFRGKD